MGLLLSAGPFDLNQLALMNFEGAGCADDRSAVEGEAVTCTATSTFEADCDTEDADCPLQGSLSGLSTSSSNHAELIGLTPSSDITTLDFIWEFGVAGNTASSFNGMISAVDNFECQCRFATTTTVFARDNSGSVGGNITVAADTTYWARMTYEETNDICILYLWSDDWGGSAVSGSPSSTATGGSAGNVVGYELGGPDGTTNHIYDDIGLCDEDLGSGTTHCGD